MRKVPDNLREAALIVANIIKTSQNHQITVDSVGETMASCVRKEDMGR